ncbi:MAG: hypothetical protein KJS92_02295 [Bacteroidetes bacterium]|nr:hypothetical protein [Bacteroidota bacterium]
MQLKHYPLLLALGLLSSQAQAQTDNDALWMPKKNLCGGIIYQHGQWNHYWEGTFYRENLNIGTVSSKMAMAMASYGINDNLNAIVMLPWIKNQASAGTLIGQQGVQDLSVALKQHLLGRTLCGKYYFNLAGVAGGSTPMTNYVADYLPLSIGMHSTNGYVRAIADVERNKWYATATASYMLRSNVKIDRTAYYTTEMNYSNVVRMPSVANMMLRIGYRLNADKFVELIAERMETIGGFDIRRNDMPFLSNNMDALRTGIAAKWALGKGGLSLMGSGMYTLAGRNMGRSTMLSLGAVYQIDFNKKTIITN